MHASGTPRLKKEGGLFRDFSSRAFHQESRRFLKRARREADAVCEVTKISEKRVITPPKAATGAIEKKKKTRGPHQKEGKRPPKYRAKNP